MLRTRLGSAACLSVLLVLGGGAGQSVTAQDDEPEHIQTSAEAEASDLQAIADANGWTLAEARTDRHATDVIGDIAIAVSKKRPEKFIGSAVGPEPDAKPRLYIKGATDGYIEGLVEDADIGIRIIDEQPYNFDELYARLERVQEAFLDIGLKDFSGAVDIDGAGRIPMTVRQTESTPSREELMDAIPANLRDDVVLALKAGGSWEEDHARGGMRTSSSSTSDDHVCTSGFSVLSSEGPGGPNGVAEAAHCDPDINRIGSELHSMTLQGSHYGTWGDIEWFTTDTTEQPIFYAETDEPRYVTSAEFRSGISQNEQVCAFGRSSLYRACSRVEDATAVCTGLGHLVEMDEDSMNGGDSGGPWFRDNRAFGIHHGPCGDGDNFTPVDNLSILETVVMIDE